MTIYIPVLYVCLGLQCTFFQSETFTTDLQNCKNEIAQQKENGKKQGMKVDAICVDVNIVEEKRTKGNQ